MITLSVGNLIFRKEWTTDDSCGCDKVSVTCASTVTGEESGCTRRENRVRRGMEEVVTCISVSSQCWSSLLRGWTAGTLQVIHVNTDINSGAWNMISRRRLAGYDAVVEAWPQVMSEDEYGWEGLCGGVIRTLPYGCICFIINYKCRGSQRWRSSRLIVWSFTRIIIRLFLCPSCSSLLATPVAAYIGRWCRDSTIFFLSMFM